MAEINQQHSQYTSGQHIATVVQNVHLTGQPSSSDNAPSHLPTSSPSEGRVLYPPIRSPTERPRPDYRIYEDCMIHLGYGFPLWSPDPGEGPSIEIGDVGYYDEGRFVKIFPIPLAEVFSGIPVDQLIHQEDRDVLPSSLFNQIKRESNYTGPESEQLQSSAIPTRSSALKVQTIEAASLLLQSPLLASKRLHKQYTNRLKEHVQKHFDVWLQQHFSDIDLEDIVVVYGTCMAGNWNALCCVAAVAGNAPDDNNLGLFKNDGQLQWDLWSTLPTHFRYGHRHNDYQRSTPFQPYSFPSCGKACSTSPPQNQCAFIRTIRFRRKDPNKAPTSSIIVEVNDFPTKGQISDPAITAPNQRKTTFSSFYFLPGIRNNPTKERSNQGITSSQEYHDCSVSLGIVSSYDSDCEAIYTFVASQKASESDTDIILVDDDEVAEYWETILSTQARSTQAENKRSPANETSEEVTSTSSVDEGHAPASFKSGGQGYLAARQSSKHKPKSGMERVEPRKIVKGTLNDVGIHNYGSLPSEALLGSGAQLYKRTPTSIGLHKNPRKKPMVYDVTGVNVANTVIPAGGSVLIAKNAENVEDNLNRIDITATNIRFNRKGQQVHVQPTSAAISSMRDVNDKVHAENTFTKPQTSVNTTAATEINSYYHAPKIMTRTHLYNPEQGDMKQVYEGAGRLEEYIDGERVQGDNQEYEEEWIAANDGANLDMPYRAVSQTQFQPVRGSYNAEPSGPDPMASNFYLENSIVKGEGNYGIRKHLRETRKLPSTVMISSGLSTVARLQSDSSHS